MNTYNMLQSLISSLILPFLMEVIMQRSWDRKIKFICSVVITALLSFTLAYVNNQIQLSDIPQTILLTFFLTETNYQLWFKKSLIQEYIAEKTQLDESKPQNSNDS